MRQREDNHSDLMNIVDQQKEASAPAIAASRRKFVAQAAAAPVLLTVAGRSALACQTTNKGCSFAAWCSANPKGKGAATTCNSHTVAGHDVTGCYHPKDWTPKPKSTNCFTVYWPSSCKPWGASGETCWRYSSYQGKYVQVGYVRGQQYSNMCRYYTENSTNCAGWKTGTKLTWLDPYKSISQILLDEPGSARAHIAAAWLNASNTSNYVLTQDQVRELWQRRRIGTAGYVLEDSNLIAFLEQACLPPTT